MYYREKKRVPIKKYHIGDKFDNVVVDGCSHYCSMELIAINNFTFTVKVFNKYEETYSIENAFVEEKITEKELKAKYSSEIKEIVEKFQTEYNGDHGYHEMDNVWLCYSIPELASYLKQEEKEILGYFRLPKNEQKWDGLYDIGVVFYDKCYNEKYWTHGSLKNIEYSIKELEKI